MWVREIFSGADGRLSSKRIIGTLLVTAAVVVNLLGLGDAETNRVMIWAGIAAIGVGTLETKVSK